MRILTNASFKEWQALPSAPLSLTPALSRWERLHEPPRLTNCSPEPPSCKSLEINSTSGRFMGRENRPPILPRIEDGDCRTIPEKHQSVRLLFPLPQGQGEGEAYKTPLVKLFQQP